MTLRIEWTRGSLADLEEIAAYLVQRSPRAAQRVRAEILRSVRFLSERPRAGRKQKVPGVRKWPIGRYRYLIYYHFDEAGDTLQVLRVRHSSRRRNFRDA